MDLHRFPAAFAFGVVAACASRPNPPPPGTADDVQMTPASSEAGSVPEATTPAPVEPDPNDPTTPEPTASESEATPGVELGAVVVRGELHPTRVEARMRTAYPAVRECHKKALDARWVEEKSVHVQLNFEITETGEMTKLTYDTADYNPLFSSCVLRAVVNVKFDAPKSGRVRVTYPLELTKP